MKFKTIPFIPTITGWKEVEIEAKEEKLVSLRDDSNPNLIIEPMYYIQGLDGAINDCYVREIIKEMLIEASELLPEGYKFIIWDTWRPLEVQNSLFQQYKTIFEKEQPSLTEDELIEYTQKYVSLPSLDDKKPSPHNTGGSVDLSIVDKNGNLLYMGTEFDEMTSIAGTRYFEEALEKGIALSSKELEALENRRLLFHVMTSAGFTNYFEEWWHFDFGNQFYGKVTGKKAIYGRTTP